MVPRRVAVPVSDVMTSKVRTVHTDQPIEEILEIFRKDRCHHVPVVDGHRPVGMVSARDLLSIARARLGEQSSASAEKGMLAGDVMSKNLVTILEEESVEIAIERIGQGDLHALVVVDEDSKLAGIVTHHDLLYYLMD